MLFLVNGLVTNFLVSFSILLSGMDLWTIFRRKYKILIIWDISFRSFSFWELIVSLLVILILMCNWI